MFTYNVKVTDRLLRFDTTSDSVTVILLPFSQTPNAPYEIQRISTGDGNTVTIQVNGAPDFLLADGSTAITLNDSAETVYIKIPDSGVSPAYVSWGSGGGGGGGGTVIVPAPPVTIGAHAVLPRDNGKVEIDVAWTPAASANAQNFTGVAIYLEDPDISSGTQAPLDGTTPLNGTAQVSGAWQPKSEGNSTKSPASVLVDKQAGDRDVRIYLASYGPNTTAHPIRANQPNATPNVMVDVPGMQSGQSGQEYAFLVTNPQVTVVPDYDRPDPNYYLTFSYTPPDPSTPIPANMQPFGACRIVYVQVDANNANPQFPGTDTALDVPLQWDAGFKSPIYYPKSPNAPAPPGGQFRAYFCSEDTLGDINTLVEGVTPYALATVPALTPAPDVSNFVLTNPGTVWLADGSFVNQVSASWTVPASAQYAGVILYLVNVTGTAPLSKFPLALTAQEANVDVNFVLQIPNGTGAVIPSDDETWTVAAISVSAQGALSDHPELFGQTPPAGTPAFHSPTATWTVGPPQPGSAGSGQEYAPFVTIDPGANVTATETTSADGVRMVSFQVGTWTDPTDNQFGGAKLAMVINHDPTRVTYWDVGTATAFTTPAMPAMGTIGQPVAVNFYVVSYDPQGNQNSLQQGTTPRILYNYTPSAGAIIPARSGWFDPTQFNWPSGGSFSAGTFSAQNIFVGTTLVVGGAGASFGGSYNGQIAVKDSSGNLLGWIGMQQPTQGKGAPLYGAWFKQLWVGGSDPTTAPLWVDNQGIIEVGGIAAAQGSQYPYISIRDSHGLEMGRIGAQISVNSGSPGDNTGGSPPQLTAGAWFTQLAVGGSSLTNWNILITPSASNPLGSNFQMRNIALLSIDYPYNSAPSGYFNNEYRFDVGNSVWMAAGLPSGTYVFPGIHIYEVDGNQNNFGATFISRGMVLRGTASQNYQVLLSLVAFNGNSSGQDSPSTFYGELTMYCPVNAAQITVDLASGSSASNNPYLRMSDLNGNTFLWVDIDHFAFRVNGVLQGMNGAPIEANAYAIYGYTNPSGNNQVINSAGQWVGQPIATGSSQSPWTGPINGNGQSLSNAGAITCSSVGASGAISGASVSASGTVAAGSFAMANNPGSPVINANGAFIGAGVDVRPNNSVGGLYLIAGTPSVGGLPGGSVAASSVIAGSSFALISNPGNPVINSNGAFQGAGVNCPSYGVSCGSVSCGASAGNSGQVACLMLTCYSTTVNYNGISTNSVYSSGAYTGGPFNGSSVSVSGVVNAGNFQVNGAAVTNGTIWTGSLQANAAVYGSIFGIYGIAQGYPTQNYPNAPGSQSFATNDGRRVYVLGGLIVGIQ